MKKAIPALLAVALLLTGCGKQASDDTLALPKITHADAPSVSDSPAPAPTALPTLNDVNIPSEISELYIMDEGYHANAVTGLGDTLLAADLDEADYQLVLAHYKLTGEGMVELSDRKVLLQGPNEEDVYQAEIRGISAGPDGCYYVLTAEAPRKAMHIDLATADYKITENPDYSGKFRVLKYSTNGVLLNAVDYNNLPIDATGVFAACSEGKLLLFCFESVPESQRKDESDFNTINSTSLIVLDFSTGGYDVFRYGMYIVDSACPYGEKAIVFLEQTDDVADAGFYSLDLSTGKFEKINWPYTFGEDESSHIPFCFWDEGQVIVNNQTYYGVFDPETFGYAPLLNSIPENQSAPIPEHPEYLDYPMFSTCCRIGEQTFVGAGTDSAALFVISPA